MLSLDENTRKMITGKTEITRAPMNVDNPELIDAIARIAITGFAAHERRRFEVQYKVPYKYQQLDMT